MELYFLNDRYPSETQISKLILDLENVNGIGGNQIRINSEFKLGKRVRCKVDGLILHLANDQFIEDNFRKDILDSKNVSGYNQT